MTGAALILLWIFGVLKISGHLVFAMRKTAVRPGVRVDTRCDGGHSGRVARVAEGGAMRRSWAWRSPAGLPCVKVCPLFSGGQPRQRAKHLDTAPMPGNACTRFECRALSDIRTIVGGCCCCCCSLPVATGFIPGPCALRGPRSRVRQVSAGRTEDRARRRARLCGVPRRIAAWDGLAGSLKPKRFQSMAVTRPESPAWRALLRSVNKKRTRLLADES
jgi:hypothetical protein